MQLRLVTPTSHRRAGIGDASHRIPLKNHTNAIRAAVAKGHSLSLIADVLGVTAQAVWDFAEKNGIRRHVGPQTQRKHRTTVVGRCEHCGNVFERRLHQREKNTFCSWKCSGAAQRMLTGRDIVSVIQQRLNGRQWNSLSAPLGVSRQALQVCLYQFLHAHGLDTEQAFAAIWNNREGSYSKGPPRLAWLFRQKDDLLTEASISRFKEEDLGDIVRGLLAGVGVTVPHP